MTGTEPGPGQALGTWAILRGIAPTLLILITIFASMGVVAPVLAPLQDDLGLSVFLTGMVVSAFAAGRLVAGFPAGVWAERLGENRLLTAGALAFLLGSALCAWSPSAALLLVGRFVQGVGSAVVAAAALATILRSVPANQSGQAMSYYNGGIQIGIVFGPVAGGYLSGHFAWRAVFLFGVVTSAVALAIGLASLWRHRRNQRPRTGETKRGAGMAGLPLGLLALGVVPNLLCFFNRVGINQLGLPLHLARNLGQDPIGTAGVLTAGVLVSLALLVPSGKLVDRIGAERALRLALPVTALGIALFAWLDSVPGAYAAVTVFNLGMAVVGPASGAYLFGLPGVARNRAIGVYRLSTDIAQISSPLLVAPLIDTMGLEGTFLAAAALNASLLAYLYVSHRAATANRP